MKLIMKYFDFAGNEVSESESVNNIRVAYTELPNNSYVSTIHMGSALVRVDEYNHCEAAVLYETMIFINNKPVTCQRTTTLAKALSMHKHFVLNYVNKKVKSK